jgi:hypothetical protein
MGRLKKFCVEAEDPQGHSFGGKRGWWVREKVFPHTSSIFYY